MLSARWASTASTSTSMTFASSPIPSSVRHSPSIVASLSWHDRNDRVDPLRRGRDTSSLPGGAVAYRRSFFTRTTPPPLPLLPLPAVAAGGGERTKKKRNSGSDRRRSSSTALKSKRRILPSEMPKLPQLSRRGQRQWRTLLEDEVREDKLFRFSTSSAASAAAAHLLSLSPLLSLSLFENTPHETTTAPSPRRGHSAGDPRDHE